MKAWLTWLQPKLPPGLIWEAALHLHCSLLSPRYGDLGSCACLVHCLPGTVPLGAM